MKHTGTHKMAGMTYKMEKATRPVKKHKPVMKKAKGMSHSSKVKTATPEVHQDRMVKKVTAKANGKKATEKRMVKPSESKAKNPENKFVWKPFGR